LRVSAHRVEYDVGVADDLLEARRRVIDRVVGAQRPQESLIARRRRADHPRALPFRELDREVPDAACRGMDEHRLPRAKSRGVE